MTFVDENPVLSLTLAFIAISLMWSHLVERIQFLTRSNLKYRILDFLASFIYYGADIGVTASLSLDNPSEDVLQRRLKGHEYLNSKLGGGRKLNVRGQELSAKLVDCRFSLAKVLMPLLRELEFSPAKRNFVTEVITDKGMHQVILDTGKEKTGPLLYCGSDTVHTLGVKSFHAPIQKEINRRMVLTQGDSALRFSPIAMNTELEKNAKMILNMTGMDQVRYSLSGSEAMDAAFKDVRASTRGVGDYIVRFSSAYHGHVSGVDFLNSKKVVYLKECSQESLDFIEKYHFRIAGVVVNPMQHFTGVNKASPPGEKLTIGTRQRHATSKEEYARWLHSLQEKCRYCTKYLTKIVFIIDDIYFAFRSPEFFSKDYFRFNGRALEPDVMVLGKGVAAGYPLSMVLGRRGCLNAYDKKFLLQVNKTVGTLSAWHGGLVASNVFLEAVSKGAFIDMPAKDQLSAMGQRFDAFTSKLNGMYEKENLPIRIRNFSNTFSINYLVGSLYNSRYPQYLMAEGIFLGNYSTGKFNLNADATDSDLDSLAEKFVAAGKKMEDDAYFEPQKNKIWMLLSLLARFMVNYMKLVYSQIMLDKKIDIDVSHNHPVNKFGHFWSSVFMILVAYPLIYAGYPIEGCKWFFLTHVVRQSGHFFFEHQDRDIEKLKFGHKDASKKGAAVFLAAAAIVYQYRSEIWARLSEYVTIELKFDQYVSIVALFTVVPHAVQISYEYGFIRGLSWLLKILTDPFTDILDFWEFAVIHPKWFVDLKDPKAVYKLDIVTKKVAKLE
eukprot:scaffold1083_cov114-Cylindrotheca_fusiformis.AAC.8